MSALRTCKNCTLEHSPCERREGVKAGLVGLGVTSVKFTCAVRTPIFTPGQRVSTIWTVGNEWGDECVEAWPATVIKEVAPQFLIKVDDVLSDHETAASEYFKNKSLFVKARVGKLRPLDEPSVRLCPTCDRPGDGPLGSGGCYAQPAASVFSGYTPQGCAAAAPNTKDQDHG